MRKRHENDDREDFSDMERAWTLQQLRRTMGDDCDLAWRAEAQAAFEAKKYDAAGLIHVLAASNAARLLKK